MKKIIMSEQYILSMYEYLMNYCQLKERDVYRFQNYSHDQIKMELNDHRILRFPMQYYQEDLVRMGAILCVKDRSGKVLFYVNPILLSFINKGDIYACLVAGQDLCFLKNILYMHSNFCVEQCSYASTIPGVTSKKSYQKK